MAEGGLVTIRGIVTDAATHDGLPGATVLLKGTDTSAWTDASGAFSLTVPASENPVCLTVYFIGYASQEHLASANQVLTIALTEEAMGMLEGVMVAGGVYQRPWPWHPRRFFSWSKYWLAKPFGRK